MSIEIARTTLDMSLRLVAQRAAQQREMIEAQARLAREAQSTPEAAADLVTRTVENLGRLIDLRV